MALNTKTFGEIVQDFAATVQARAAGLVDFEVGAILRAVAQATAGVVLWLQAQILALLKATRLATSDDGDADTFVADFFGPFVDGTPATFKRLGAVASIGDVTFSRFSASGVAVVPAPDEFGIGGATVATSDGTQRFSVVLDTTNPAYDAGLGGYVMANTVASVTVATKALTPGSVSNVLAGAVNTITSAIPGVDTVVNAAAFINGQDTESTAAMNDRFRRHIVALREATPAAIEAYTLAVQSGLRMVNVEGADPDGTPHAGFFYVIVDDGTGSPTSDLLNAVRSVVDAHRADGIEFAVIAPTVIDADIFFGLSSSMTSEAADRALAIAAVRSYVDALEIGETLILTRLYQVAYDASPTITDIIGLTINAGTADLAAPLPNVIKADAVIST